MLSAGAWNDNIITDYLENISRLQPQKTALIAYRTQDSARTELSYGELDRMARRMACGLAAMGIEKGQVISCQLPNWWQMVALHLACMHIGVIINPLMPIFRERELRFMLQHAESRLLIIPRRFKGFDYAAMIETLRPQLPLLEQVLIINADNEENDSFQQTLLEPDWENRCDSAALFESRRPHADDVIQLLYTSGTTGEPKGVLHTSNTLFANIRPYAERLGLSADEVVFMASPMAHQTGFLYGLMMPIYLHGTAVLQDAWVPEFAAKVAEREKPTFTMASTPFLADLVSIAPHYPQALSSLRIFVAAGAPIPGALVEKAASVVDARIISAWGMTENGAVTLTRLDDPHERSVNSDGVALPHTQLKIVDSNGEAVPCGSEGHLLVRGASLFIGYLKRPDLYEVDEQGWFATGDLARMDAEGYIRITGRNKDVVIRGGENIPVVEVENLLYQHPAISAVALVGCPDERLGERLCAFVSVQPDQPEPTLAELVRFLLDQQLTKNYLPEHLEILPDLPRTPSGKIQKFKLREMARDIRVRPARNA